MQPVLNINLSTQKIEVLNIPREWEEEFLGGSSLASRILYNKLRPEVQPLAPESPILFLTGPLTGTKGPSVGRFTICGRSPLTQLWAESNCGGFWGSELRKTGFDGILLMGKSDKPVYLILDNGRLSFHSAAHLWGLDTYATQQKIREEQNAKRMRVATIGIAGENQVLYASIFCDHGRAAGRTGMGAILGSKNLKAIGVIGSKTIPIQKGEQFAKLRSEINRQMISDPLSLVLRQLGTGSVSEYYDFLGEMPKKYFHFRHFPEELEISGAKIQEKILRNVSACDGCVIACGRVVDLGDGVNRKGPEYETQVGFGPNLWINDLNFTTRMGELCDLYGLDTISTSNTIGLVFHLFDKGFITSKDTFGLTLNWGDKNIVETLISQIAHKQKFGMILAQGAKQVAEFFDAGEEAVQVNGLEVPFHDPRGASGMAIVYATSPIGASHNHSDYYLADIGRIEPELGLEVFDRLGGSEKSANIAIHQNWLTFLNALVMCLFANVPPHKIVSIVNAVNNTNLSTSDALMIGERAWNLKRIINNRFGLTRYDDKLPKALLTAYQDLSSDETPFIPDFDSMINEYYLARKWDPKTGYPSEDKLIELKLDWAMEDIYPESR